MQILHRNWSSTTLDPQALNLAEFEGEAIEIRAQRSLALGVGAGQKGQEVITVFDSTLPNTHPRTEFK